MTEKITVIMPVYNSEKYLKESIESILCQTYSNFELLIIDDGSTDSSLEIINSYNDDRIKVFKNERNKGVVYTRNRGIELSDGEYIAFMDSDDISKPNRLEVEIKFLKEHKDFDVVSSRSEVLIGDELYKVHKKIKKFNIANIQLIFSNPVVNTSTMFKKKFIRDNNIIHREENFVAEDYAFWVECANFSKIAILSEPLVIYRQGHDNTTKLSINNKWNERKKIIDDIKIKQLNDRGIFLNNKEYILFNKIFSDPVIDISIEDVCEYKKILNKFIYIRGYDNKLVSNDIKLVLTNRIIGLKCRKIKKLNLINFKLKNESMISYIKNIIIIKVFLIG